MNLIDRGRVMIDYLNNLGRQDSYKAKFEALRKAVDDAPAVEVKSAEGYELIRHLQNTPVVSQEVFDAAANFILRFAEGRKINFRTSEAECRECGVSLLVYYCENRTYVVKCPACETLTIVKAANPAEAAARVGKVELVHLIESKHNAGGGASDG